MGVGHEETFAREAVKILKSGKQTTSTLLHGPHDNTRDGARSVAKLRLEGHFIQAGVGEKDYLLVGKWAVRYADAGAN